ncbi:phage protein Gp13 family protein [Anaeroselena agilis]|uniref:DUF2833 domain-containing protein n=1 Tax=Anaeroselena agilis TaxID=3063788 RepID=A0ABU3NV00_9FIRM|nr:DUF2833 domain-containing protein [Selenomonadales bacterium 4137-cl]
MIVIKPLLVKHFQDFIAHARLSDFEEVKAATGQLFQDLPAADVVLGTRAIIREESGEVLGIGGLEHFGDRAAIWVMLTTHVEKHPIEFLRFSKKYLKDTIFRRYREVANYVHKDNRLHIKWLNWLGAEWLPFDHECLKLFVLSRGEDE